MRRAGCDNRFLFCQYRNNVVHGQIASAARGLMGGEDREAGRIAPLLAVAG